MTKKRKADALGRMGIDDGDRAPSSGRGSIAGWTTCPLCGHGRHSSKRYAVGRGLAAHLHAVHAPWNPGKVERKRRRRERERATQERKRRRLQDADGEEDEEDTATQQLETWEPSQREREEWDETVLRIVAEVDAQRDAAKVEVVPSGFDRNGKVAAVSYRNSLPPFLRAAADGDLEVLRNMVAEAENVFELLNTRDRHLSTAEHWAAGSGHLYCLQFLCRLQKTEQPEEEHASSVAAQSSRRRRDGKTSLHYAARNGRVPVMQYLIEQEKVAVDCPSNDGTTPFHLACFGGHLAAIHYLLSKGANVLQENDWGCSAAHWVAMTKSTDRENIRQLCNLLKSRGVSFTDRQKQGHTALHKAAQRQNRHVIEWLAESRDEGGAGLFDEEKRRCSQPDDGGHTPAEIWLSCGGDKDFADKMKKEFGG